ncbi:hypothetical protein LAZ67_8000051 [Cordylochernes scorpioides]|uniref:Mos1 transposase HTH domain-containing protein n=1 Tax=Cordylochernes scorpioides TaxID=51811 RepID=A0ABY6KPJ9_9ARAC|nr:hypothetical protein LAZ67_8000051 [Cordylochernes scorpioides]
MTFDRILSDRPRRFYRQAMAFDPWCTMNLAKEKTRGDSSLITAFEWFKRFIDGRTYIKDNTRCGRPKTVNIPENVDKS